MTGSAALEGYGHGANRNRITDFGICIVSKSAAADLDAVALRGSPRSSRGSHLRVTEKFKANSFSRREAPELCHDNRKTASRSRIASHLSRRWDRLRLDHAQRTKRKRNAGRRISPNLRALRARLALSGARSPVGVPPRHLLQRTNATAHLQNALPGTWLRSGRYPLSLVQVQRPSRRPVIMPAGRLPEAAREQSMSLRNHNKYLLNRNNS